MVLVRWLQRQQLSDRTLVYGFFAHLILGRILTAWFMDAPAHPDEWVQTLEMAEILRGLLGTHSQEVQLHLRNMTWPSVLAAVGTFLDVFLSERPLLRLAGFHLFVALLDLAWVWGVWKYASALGLKSRERLAVLAICFLPLFTWRDHVRLGIEHVSNILFWAGVGFFFLRRPATAGFLMGACAMVRYPSGLLGVGFLAGWLLSGKFTRTELFRFGVGGVLGVLACGFCDFLIYGRYFESFYMYLQYNVVTPLASEVFGNQGPSVYWDWFRNRWIDRWIWIPVLPLMLWGLCLPLQRRFRNRFKDPVFWAGFAYLIGILAVGHKEHRFMMVAEPPFLVFAATNLILWADGLERGWKRWLSWALAVLLFVNFFPSIRIWKGNWNKPHRQLISVLGEPMRSGPYQTVCDIYFETDHEGMAYNHLGVRRPRQTPFRITYFYRALNTIERLESLEPCSSTKSEAVIYLRTGSLLSQGCRQDSLLRPKEGAWWFCDSEIARNWMRRNVCTTKNPRCLEGPAFADYVSEIPRIAKLPDWRDKQGMINVFDSRKIAPVEESNKQRRQQ